MNPRNLAVASLLIGLIFTVEQVEVVSGCYGNYIVFRMPGGVQDLLVVVKRVDRYLVFFPFARAAEDLPRLKHLFRLHVFSGCLQRQVLLTVAVDYSEEIVV